MSNSQSLDLHTLSSLIKVFPDTQPAEDTYQASVLQGETFSFQVAYYAYEPLRDVHVDFGAGRGLSVDGRRVGLVASELAVYPGHDDWVLRANPGLFPDPLYPVGDDSSLVIPAHQWRALWVTVRIQPDCEPERHSVTVRFRTASGTPLGSAEFWLDVLPVQMPTPALLHTEWFYTDCLATWHRVRGFSKSHWRWIDRYLQNAVDHGVNTILTPLFTPPLDTMPGGERPTMQLVGVGRKDGQYSFNFTQLDRWVDLCQRRGITHFEWAHLFTQWGARYAPKIVVREGGVERVHFGWRTPAAEDPYSDFLKAFLPALARYTRRSGLQGRTLFHVADEPSGQDLAAYRLASSMVRGQTGGAPILDALSDFRFYQQGLVDVPVVATDHVDPFLQASVANLWVYYCCSQDQAVSNRFFAMPSVRTRLLGLQLFKYQIKGFLHWGYNHWYGYRSRHPIDPFLTTDVECAYPSGDAFVVYPSDAGPIDSLRWEVFYQGLQDLAVFDLYRERVGPEAALSLLEQGLPSPLTFRTGPVADAWLLGRREAVNRALAAPG